MKTADICALDVASIAADDCALFMWATFPNLQAAFAVIEAWGFKYITVGFCWAKDNRVSPGWHMGMGRWTRSNAEVCLFATKGRPVRRSAAVSSLVVAPVGRHSAKPAEVRGRIVDLLGDLPRVELFARENTDGWDVWGNDASLAQTCPSLPTSISA